MTDSRKRSRVLDATLTWIAVWQLVVPRWRRATWRDQWRADLWHYWVWLSNQRYPRHTRGLRLLGRAAAAPLHAVVLRGLDWSLSMLMNDFRQAWRMIVRRPAFTFVAVLILGLGIGANATIFSWVETVLLRPLPGVPGQDRLVALRGTTRTRTNLSFSYPNYVDLRNGHPDGFEDVIAFRPVAMSLRGDGAPVRVWGELVTPNFFDVLRVKPMLGRTFLSEEGATPGGSPVVVLSESAWRQHFDADAAIVGRAITLNARPYTVIGVAPRGFHGSVAGLSLGVFVPMTMQGSVMGSDRLGLRGNSFLLVFGRLGDGATIDRAQASASVVAERLARDHPDFNRDRGIVVLPLYRDGASSVLMPVMATLMGVAGVVLLIASANLAGLLLARAAGRQREVAVRLAVGASRARLIRQFLIESAALAAAGGTAGVVVSYWTAGLLDAFVPPTPVPVSFTPELSPLVLGFSVAVTFATALLFGLLPAFRGSRPDVVDTLKQSAATVVRGRSRGWLRHSLVVSQVALSLLLLLGAALFARSFARAQDLDPGFSLRNGFIASVDLLSNGYDERRGIVLFQQILDRIGTVSGVSSVTIAAAMPLDIGSGSDMSVHVEGYEPRAGEEISVSYNRVGPRYFETMGIPIIRGRAIDHRDVTGRELAVVINETMARRYWGDRDPVGGIVRFGSGPAKVVGIARDGKYARLNETPPNYMYIAAFQHYRPDMAVIVRTESPLETVIPAVHGEIRQLEPNLPLFDVRSIAEHLQLRVFLPRMASTMLLLFGGLSLLLASVGLYSVIAFSVAQRTHEIGIRMALGASHADVRRMILTQGLAISGLGIAIGLAAGLAVAPLIRSQLMVAPVDPLSFAGTVAVLMTVSLTACLLPARRAAAMDPLRAIRRE